MEEPKSVQNVLLQGACKLSSKTLPTDLYLDVIVCHTLPSHVPGDGVRRTNVKSITPVNGTDEYLYVKGF
ncbi:hypothetical protein ACS0TY_007308 [Phlomoides rotata]